MALDWLPILPDGPKRVYVRRTASEVLYATLSPIPQPAPPTELTWQPQFPVHPQRYRQQNLSQARPIFVPLPTQLGLSWQPIFRVQPIRRPPPHPTLVIQGDPGAQPAIASFPTWRTMWTAPTHRRAQRLQEGNFPIAMSTLINAAGCIELTAEALTTPLLTPESTVSPSLLSETFTSPTLTEEDLC